MAIFFKSRGSVNVRVIIKEEKILSNIDKVKKLINPKSKKKIIKLENDAYFRDLIESISSFLSDYPNKSAFPADLYKAAYDLVEYATIQFEENNRQIADLIGKREENIRTAYILKEALTTVSEKEAGWEDKIGRFEGKFDKAISEALTVVANSTDLESEETAVAVKMLKSKISNLESNLFIEVDIERIEDRSKALSSIGIELAEALKTIQAPVETIAKAVVSETVNDQRKVENVQNVQEIEVTEEIKEEVPANEETIEIPQIEMKEIIQEENVAEQNLEDIDVLTGQEAEKDLAITENVIQENAEITEEEQMIKEAMVEVKPSFMKRVWSAFAHLFKISRTDELQALPEAKNN